MANAFLTGSRVYGKPRKNSDIDLVVQCDDQTKDVLFNLSEKAGCVFGKLNLILVDAEQYGCWLKGTEKCIATGRQLNREEAVEIMIAAGVKRSTYPQTDDDATPVVDDLYVTPIDDFDPFAEDC